MQRKVMSKNTLLENKEQLLAEYNAVHPKSGKPKLLTKKERKVLGIGKDEGRAALKYARISSRKMKIVIDLIKGKQLDEAYAIVRYTPKAASDLLFKLLKSAEANAVNNNELNRDLLYIEDMHADQGPTLKRMIPKARGSGARINKRTSHVTVVLKERK
jgi:large subunit ribosomal protein L22